MERKDRGTDGRTDGWTNGLFALISWLYRALNSYLVCVIDFDIINGKTDDYDQ